MSPSRFRAIYNGLSSLHRKVFDGVPLIDAWTSRQVLEDLVRRDVPVTRDLRTIEHCLGALNDAGLLVKPDHSTYRRVHVSVAEQPQKKEPQVANNPQKQASVITAADLKKPAPASDRLAALSSKVAEMSRNLATLAKEIDDAVLDVAQEVEDQLGQVQKLRDVMRLIREI